MGGPLVTILTLPVLLAGPGPSPGGSDARRELQILDRALDAAVRRVSRAGVVHMLGAGDACRSYRLPGYGAVWVLAPRVLPGPARTFLRVPGRAGNGPALEAAIRSLEAALSSVQSDQQRAELEKRLRMLRAQQTALAPPGKARRLPGAVADDLEQELRAIEAQAQAFDREAEQARQEAERAFDQMEHEVRRLRVVAVPAPAAEAAVAGVASAPPDAGLAPVDLPPAPPAPPWRFWFEEAEEDASGSPDVVIRDVRAALLEALVAQAPKLTSFAPEEHLVVAVDFLPRGGFVPARPERTLVLRALKKDLAARRSGTISAEELEKRIEASDY